MNQKPEILAVKSNEILTAVIHGARKEEAPEVQYAAIQALYNSLEFVRDNFEREVRCLLAPVRIKPLYLIYLQGERNYIMQIVCEATQSSSVNVQVGAFECLVKIMSLYYDKMAFYMERALFGVCFIDHGTAPETDFSPIVDCHGYEAHRRANCTSSH